MTIPVAPSVVAGDRVTATRWTSLVSALNYWGPDRPRVHAYRNTGTPTATSSTWLLLTYDTEDFDVGGFHDTAVNPTRYVFPETGLYAVHSVVQFAANGSGRRGYQCRLNAAGSSAGGTLLQDKYVPPPPTGESTVERRFVREFTAGDYVEFWAWQDSGVSLAVDVGIRDHSIVIELIGLVA